MLILQKLKEDSLPVNYRIEHTFSHAMTKCCCQPHPATSMPDVIHTAVPSSSSMPSARRARGGGEQVPAGAQGVHLGPGEPRSRRHARLGTGPPPLSSTARYTTLASHLTPAWVCSRSSLASDYSESVFRGPRLSFAMSEAVLGPRPWPLVGSPAPGLKPRPRREDPPKAPSGK